jgi:outer membrane protein TolC/cell division septation protein DedD
MGILAGALILAGCASVDPVPLEKDALKTQAKADREAAQRDVEPLAGPITLEEAIARGLKYNLDRRTRLMEETIAFGQLDVSKYDMLPKLVASAGYHSRSEYLMSRSVDSTSMQEVINTTTGQPFNPSISSDKTHSTRDLGLTWNMLDFGLSYSTAKQNADRALIASERRRKAMHALVQDIRTAFWRAASAQKLHDQVKSAIVRAEDALADARKAEDERLRSPLDSLRYQRQVLENLRLLETIDQELSTARIELATLINLPLAANLQVVEPTEALSRRMLDLPAESLEELAIAQNADLREQFYNTRIVNEETRKTILRLFPSLSFNFDVKTDTDKFLVHNSWNEAGVQLSFSLLNLLSAPTQTRLAEAGVALADQRRIAMQMAVLAQLHIARLQYANALQQYERSDAIWRVDNRISHHVANREQAEAQSKMEKVAADTATILSQLRRYQALAAANAAASRLQATLGMEPELGSVRELSLKELQTSVAAALKQWDNAELPGATKIATTEAPAQPVQVVQTEPPVAEPQPPVAAASQPREEAPAKPAAMATKYASAKPIHGKKRWVVQLGAYRDSELANELVRRTSSLDLAVFLNTTEEGGAKFTRVQAGPFATRRAANQARHKLDGSGLHGYVKLL